MSITTPSNVSPIKQADFDGLLSLTTKTFSLGIRLLPQPLRREITIAYLLFRVADTLEDSETWSAAERVQALGDLGRLVRETASPWVRPGAGAWLDARPTEDAGCLRLLGALPDLLAALRATSPEARSIIIRHVERTIDGMIWFQTRGGRPHDLRMEDLEDLRHYSYVVAGVVGELLTALFVLRCNIPKDWVPCLDIQGLKFGEGLQLVNILKDVPDDAKGGRVFLAPGADAQTVLAIARTDLDAADGYIATLRHAGVPRGVVAFVWFTLRLARSSLDRVERDGLGTKIEKDEVMAHLAAVRQYVDEVAHEASASAGAH